MNKRPSLQFYPADWIKDPDLQMCSMNTIGIWINLLCRMWEAKEEGILCGKARELALLVGARPAEFKRFLQEVETHLFADVTKCDGVVTIKCRRMNRLFLERDGAKHRMRKHRGASGYGDVTTPSSSSSSISSSTTKNIYMDFVKLSTEEHSKLLEQFGEAGLKERLAALNDYIGSRGVKYKSHYHTILAWERKNGPRAAQKKTKLFPISGRKCSECPLPAVYKDSSGAYDFYYCADHMPKEVKAKYE